MKKALKSGGKLAFLFFFLNISYLYSQVPNNGNNPNNIPIDGGASLLAAAGVAYGIKKYRDFRKNSSEQEDNM
ncbi:PID-CTERM protein-sorting domain-containing protein [Nafulsella turpanensis]|uniref:PID-CTERM protein-sorting domain-containing protein n=1 Tax=Nafulsella turpanensis TaxID=1265690 RepID=UPI00034D8896|nr:hypothetical protein [Nafulsella turpanensis]